MVMGGPLFPKVNVKISANFNFLVKTKYVPKVLKCKINPTYLRMPVAQTIQPNQTFCFLFVASKINPHIELKQASKFHKIVIIVLTKCEN